MNAIYTVTIYNETGKVIDYASFDHKYEAEIYGRNAVGTDYRLNFSVKKIEL
jgi:hypothetical protein